MIDKSSKKWKEYCEGLLKFDDAFPDGRMVAEPNEDLVIDYGGLIQYAREKYNGNLSVMTQEEKERFITKREDKQAV
jgi:hypothetical protein